MGFYVELCELNHPPLFPICTVNSPVEEKSCTGDKFEYILEVTTDRKPEETSWTLEYQGSNGIVDIVNEGEYNERLKTYVEKGCVDFGCFIFVLKDAQFNGMCCFKGMGSYSVKVKDDSDSDKILLQEFSFTDRQDVRKFCYSKEELGPTTSPTIDCGTGEYHYTMEVTTDLFPDETSWRLAYSRIDGVDQGDYTESEKENVHEGCLPLGCYYFYIFISNDDSNEGLYRIIAGNSIVAERSPIGPFRDEDFCYFGETSHPTDHLLNSPSFSCNVNEFRYKILVKTGAVPQFYSWNLHPLIDRVPKMHYQKQLETYIHNGCYKLGCFSFFLSDERYDGFCCFYGQGAYKITFGEDFHVAGNQVGRKDFCYDYDSTMTPTQSPFATTKCNDGEFEYSIIVGTSWIPYFTFWTFKNEYGTTIESVAMMTYMETNYRYVHSGCIPHGCYQFVINDLLDQLCCFFGDGSFRVLADGILMAESDYSGRWKDTPNYRLIDFCYGPSYSMSPTKKQIDHPTMQPSISASPTLSVPTLVCEDDEFKYKLVVETDKYSPWYTSWDLKYKYPEIVGQELIDSYEDYDSDYPNKEYSHFGCAKYSCYTFEMIWGSSFRVYDVDTGSLVAQKKARFMTDERFCVYVPVTPSPTISISPSDGEIDEEIAFSILTISMAFNLQTPPDEDNVSEVVILAINEVIKLSLGRRIRNVTLLNDIELVLEYASCYLVEEDNKSVCDISMRICVGSCDVVVSDDVLEPFANTLNDAIQTGVLLNTMKEIAEEMGVDSFENVEEIFPVDFSFDFLAWPTTFPTKGPSVAPSTGTPTPTATATPTQCKPTFVQVVETIKFHILAIIAFIVGVLLSVLTFINPFATSSDEGQEIDAVP